MLSQTSGCVFCTLVITTSTPTNHNSTSWKFRSIHGEKCPFLPWQHFPHLFRPKTRISPAPKTGGLQKPRRNTFLQQVPRGRTFSEPCNHATFDGGKVGPPTSSGEIRWIHSRFWERWKIIYSLELPPFPRMPVTTRIIPFLVGNPCKPKMVVPNNQWFFLLKMISTWGVKWGYHHF